MSTAYKEKATGWRTQIVSFVSLHLIYIKKKKKRGNRGKIKVHFFALNAKDFRLPLTIQYRALSIRMPSCAFFFFSSLALDF